MGAASGLSCSRCLPTCSTVVLASRALLMGLVILIAEEGDGAVFALGLGLLLQLAIDLITTSEKIRWGRRGIRMSLEM